MIWRQRLTGMDARWLKGYSLYGLEPVVAGADLGRVREVRRVFFVVVGGFFLRSIVRRGRKIIYIYLYCLKPSFLAPSSPAWTFPCSAAALLIKACLHFHQTLLHPFTPLSAICMLSWIGGQSCSGHRQYSCPPPSPPPFWPPLCVHITIFLRLNMQIDAASPGKGLMFGLVWHRPGSSGTNSLKHQEAEKIID